MSLVGYQPLVGVLPAEADPAGGPGADAAAGQAALGGPVGRIADAARPASSGRSQGESEEGAAPDAADGPVRAVPEKTSYQLPRTGPHDLPVPAAGLDDRPSEPGVVRGHHVHPVGPGLRVPGRGDGLAQPEGAVLAAFEHDGHTVLHGGAGRSPGDVRPAGDLQHRPGRAVHQRGVHLTPAERGHQGQHGRSWPLVGQPVYRTAVAVSEVRGCLPERVRNDAGGGAGDRQVSYLLQPTAASPGTEQPDAGPGLQPHQRTDGSMNGTGSIT